MKNVMAFEARPGEIQLQIVYGYPSMQQVQWSAGATAGRMHRVKEAS